LTIALEQQNWSKSDKPKRQSRFKLAEPQEGRKTKCLNLMRNLTAQSESDSQALAGGRLAEEDFIFRVDAENRAGPFPIPGESFC